MKKLKLFFALFAMLALGVGNAWGAEASFTIKFKDNSSDASTALTTATFTKQVAEGTDLIKSVSTSYCYAGTGGLKCSSNKNNGTFTLALNNSYTISKIVLSVKNKNATTKTVKVGNTSFSTSDSWNTTSFEDLAFTGTETTSDQITVSLAGNANSKRVAYIASMTVYYKTDESGSEEPVISVEPNKVDFGTKNIYFESEKQGSLEIDITGQNLTGDVSAAISGADASVFTLSKTTFTPNSGEVSEKLSVSYSVSEVKTYTATLTLSSDGVDDIELPITLTTVNKKPTIYTKVTDAATLSAGDKVILVYESAKKAAGKISNTAGGYLNAIDITQALNTTATPATASITDEAVVEYTLGGTTGAWELISAGNKLSEKTANSSSSVDLKASGDTKWTISVTEGNATIKGTTNTIQYNEANPRFKTYTSGQKTIQLYAISVPKYAVNFTQPEGGELSVKNGETAITSGNTFAEGIKLTVTATPANGYEGGTVVVKDADGNDVTTTVYADGVLTMPAYAVTISATFEEKPCELLAKPTVSATTTYSSATLTWEAVANAAKYSVKVGTADAVETTATSYEVTGLNAETEYTYQVKAIAADGQTNYCDSEVAEGTFTTATAPIATLTLSDIEGTTTKIGALNGTITLPTEAAECSKTFVGWSAVEIPEPGEKPATNFYARGAEYTLAAETQTLYAVYADGESGEVVTQTLTITDQTTNSTYRNNSFTDNKGGVWSGQSNIPDATHFGLRQNDDNTHMASPVFPNNIINITAKIRNQSKSERKVYLCSNNTTAKPSSGDLGGVNVNGSVTDIEHTFTLNGTFNQFYIYTNGALQFNEIEVTYSSAPTYSNYSTTCAAALEKPTFSVAEGTYTEEKSIELRATEGDIYYTLDGTEPTESSTQYKAAIALNECGTTTIKAIAIGASQSPIASATYTINLPITNTAATAYTPAEAIAIIDGACDKTEEVFVKGVVVSTSAFNATYGNYDVIVKAVDDNSATPKTFTFYRMYKAASNTKFTESDEVIGVGDIITAKGVLKKYNSTYELAEGCYMVERVPFTEPKTDISNTLETAYTVDKAFELISDIKSDLDKEVYVKGLVAVASTELYEEKYLTYSISDNGQTTGNVLKIYDGLDIGGVAFASKDDVKVGDYIVVKGKLLNYKGTYEINKDNQLVEHISAATITIADITMEVDETKTIAATVVPAEAEVTYTIKENAANAISLEGNTITALAEGTATITATIAEGATYMGNSVDFTVTVNPQNIAVLPFEFDKGKTDIASTLGMSQEGLGSDYSSSPKIKFDDKDDYVIVHFDSEPGALSYTIKANVNSGDFTGGFDVQVSENGDDYDVLVSYTELEKTAAQKTHKLDKNVRYVKFVYTNKVSGQNVALGNILISKLSVLRADLYDGKWGTFCPDQKVTYMQGASFYTLTYLEMKDGMPYKLFFDEITTDYLEAGKPYLFIAEGEKIKGVKSGEVVSIASNYNGFYGNVRGSEISLTTTQTEYVAGGDVVNNYGVINSRFTLLGDGTTVAHERAYVQIKNGQLDCPNPPASLPALAPGARRVVAGATGINTATGVDQVQGDNVSTKMIINGQLFILRGEKMYNAQGKLVK